MPCIYPTHLLLGRLGSLFLRYKYSAICDQTPILFHLNLKQKSAKLPKPGLTPAYDRGTKEISIPIKYYTAP